MICASASTTRLNARQQDSCISFIRRFSCSRLALGLLCFTFLIESTAAVIVEGSDFIEQQAQQYETIVLTDDYAPIERLLGRLLSTDFGA